MKYDRLLTLTVRSAYIWAALVALVGVGLFVVFANSSDDLGNVLSLGGQALFSAGVVAVTFGWISSEENEVRIERIVERNLVSLRPMAIRALEGSISNRVWKCHLGKPTLDDPLPNYLHQTMSISYTTQECPESLRFIGIASASPDWSDYHEHQFRWEFDEGLDLASEKVFRVSSVYVDDVPLTDAKPLKNAAGREYSYKVQKSKQGQPVRISFVVSVRLFWTGSSRIPLKTKVFQDTDLAEFHLTVGEDIKAKRITSGIDGITSLVRSTPRSIRESIEDSSGRPVSHSVCLLDTIQRDSQVSFEIEIAQTQAKQEVL